MIDSVTRIGGNFARSTCKQSGSRLTERVCGRFLPVTAAASRRRMQLQQESGGERGSEGLAKKGTSPCVFRLKGGLIQENYKSI